MVSCGEIKQLTTNLGLEGSFMLVTIFLQLFPKNTSSNRSRGAENIFFAM